MSFEVLIATYGEEAWHDLAWSRAYPSAVEQAPTSCFHDPDGTIASVRNEMGRTATADWLCFLDADDEIAPGYFSAMERALEREIGGDLLLTPAVQKLRRNGRPWGNPTFFDRGIPLSDDNWLVVGTLIPRELFLKVGGFSDYSHGFEDWSLWYKATKAGARVVKVPDAIYRYWLNPKSKHKIAWRNRSEQVQTHERVAAELAAWTP